MSTITPPTVFVTYTEIPEISHCNTFIHYAIPEFNYLQSNKHRNPRDKPLHHSESPIEAYKGISETSDSSKVIGTSNQKIYHYSAVIHMNLKGQSLHHSNLHMNPRDQLHMNPRDQLHSGIVTLLQYHCNKAETSELNHYTTLTYTGIPKVNHYTVVKYSRNLRDQPQHDSDPHPNLRDKPRKQ